jgi:hypothetical protein
MKKLNQTELKILGKQILTKLREAADKAQEDLDAKTLASRKKRAQAISLSMRATNKAILGLINGLHKETGGYTNTRKEFYSKEQMSVKAITEDLKETQTAVNVPVDSWYQESEDIFQALVVAQIACPDVETLMNNVAAKFMKK